MYEVVAIILAVIAFAFLVAAIAMFIGFGIPKLMKDMNGSLEQKQIEEIRLRSSEAAMQRGKVNVFERLEKKAKPRKGNTQSLNISTTTESGFEKQSVDTPPSPATSVLRQPLKVINSDFIIEKNIVFVCTQEVI